MPDKGKDRFKIYESFVKTDFTLKNEKKNTFNMIFRGVTLI